MSKLRYLAICFIALAIGLLSCTEEPAIVAVTSVTLDSTSITLVEGESQTLTATVSPSNAENQKVLWSSSNSSVASVKEGIVTALKAGTATITAKSDDGGKTATCEITVNAKVYPVESISLDKSSYEMTEGDEFTLTATIKPDNATNKNVSWISSNTSVATVNNGKVTALKAGTATITVKTEDGGKTATCEVTVKTKLVESVSLDKTWCEMTEGDEITLTATISPANATNKNVSWSSSNTSVATVENGKVKALKTGTATITVKTEDGGKVASCEVTVMHDKSKDPIEFADEIIKEICVTTFDTNHDGEFSYAEAAVVEDLSKMTLRKKTFKSFDEFQYFTSVTKIPSSYFEGCSALTSITIPTSVKSIGQGAFYNCFKLERVDNLSNCQINRIESFTFFQCKNLLSVTLPDGVNFIGWQSFLGCENLESINFPNGILVIDGRAFDGCNCLKKIDLPDQLENIEYGAFWGCSNIIEITIPNNVQSINQMAFYGCSSLGSVYVKPSMPPVFTYETSDEINHFNKNATSRKIYVPSESLENYKAADGWSEYANDIVGYDYENDKIVE